MKYAGFVIGTVFKLAFYLVVCFIAALLCRRFAPWAAANTAAPAIAVFVSWLFLTYAEQGKRSFFAKGYLLENVIVGAVTGFGVFAIAAFIEWVFQNLSIDGFISDFDIRDTLYGTFGKELFIGIVIFGYFFHIIKMDFGRITAIIISDIAYAVYILYMNGSLDSVLQNYSDPHNILILVNLLLTGTAAGLISYYLGDMRSSCAFLAMFGFADRLTWQLFISSYRGAALSETGYLNNSILFTAVIFLTCTSLIIGIKGKE